MSIKDLLALLGISTWSPTDIESIVRGQLVAVEAAGYLHRVVFGPVCRDPHRNQLLAKHLQGGARLPQLLLDHMAKEFLDLLAPITSLASRVYLLFEGNFPPKINGIAGTARKNARERNSSNGNYAKALSVPDCLVRLLLQKLRDDPTIVPIVCPGEAEAQLMYMITETSSPIRVGFILSNDSDCLAYPHWNKDTKLIYYSKLQKDPAGRITLHGVPVSKQDDSFVCSLAPHLTPPGKQGSKNLFALYMIPVFGAAVSCDYTSLKGVGTVTALKAAGKVAEDDGTCIDFLRILSKKNAGNISTVAIGALCFLFHPVLHLDFDSADVKGCVRPYVLPNANDLIHELMTLAEDHVWLSDGSISRELSKPYAAPDVFKHVSCSPCFDTAPVRLDPRRFGPREFPAKDKYKKYFPSPDGCGAAVPQVQLGSIFELFQTTSTAFDLSLQRALTAFQSKPPRAIEIAEIEGGLVVTAAVDRSYSKEPVRPFIRLRVNTDNVVTGIDKVQCECQIKDALCCKHLVALALYYWLIARGQSKTSLLCKWICPGSAARDDVPLRIEYVYADRAPKMATVAEEEKRQQTATDSELTAHTSEKKDKKLTARDKCVKSYEQSCINVFGAPTIRNPTELELQAFTENPKHAACARNAAILGLLRAVKARKKPPQIEADTFADPSKKPSISRKF
jgi:hypothetical protein